MFQSCFLKNANGGCSTHRDHSQFCLRSIRMNTGSPTEEQRETIRDNPIGPRCGKKKNPYVLNPKLRLRDLMNGGTSFTFQKQDQK